MASKRRGILVILGGLVVAGAKGVDEAASLLARGSDEAIAASKSSDDAAKSGDDVGDDIGDEFGDELDGDGARAGDESGKSDDGDPLAEKGANAAKRQLRKEWMEEVIENRPVSDSFTLPPGSYGGFEIETNLGSTLTCEYETALNQSIDGLLFDAASFREYERSGEGDIIFAGSKYLTSSGRVSASLEANATYYLIFDNTAVGFAEETRFDVSLDVSISLENE